MLAIQRAGQTRLRQHRSPGHSRNGHARASTDWSLRDHASTEYPQHGHATNGPWCVEGPAVTTHAEDRVTGSRRPEGLPAGRGPTRKSVTRNYRSGNLDGRE